MKNYQPMLALALALLASMPAHAQPIMRRDARVHPVRGRRGMVAAQEARAAKIGADILRRGGHAIDAAVAIGFALAVSLPRAGNLGGGGFMLYHDAKAKRTHVIDFRECAPAKARRETFVERGKLIPGRSRNAPYGIGVPGSVAGLLYALETFGTRPRAAVIAPAIRLAEGLRVSEDMAWSLSHKRDLLARYPASKAIFLRPDGKHTWRFGETLVQQDLAKTLRLVAETGAKAFYQGPIAKAIAEATDGWITTQDMAAYRVRSDLQPVIGSYRGYQVHSMPMPSSGGVHLIQMLNILEGYPLAQLGHGSAATIHLMSEAMRRAYADRSKYLGDPDFFESDVARSRARARALTLGLTDKAYAKRLRATIDPQRASRSTDVRPGKPLAGESDETTHYSVVDHAGNIVSVTTTLNFSFGSGKVAPGTGVLLNNELDDFAMLPGVPNAYGLLGGKANAVAPGKRPLSSMTPTLVFKDGMPWLATGSPGGSRIITTTLQLIINLIDHRMNLAEASHAARVHHQWLPDELRVERGLSPDTLRLLREHYRHAVKVKASMGSTQSVLRQPDGSGYLGASDPRRPGAAAIGID